MILFAKSVAQLDWDDKMFHYVLVLATIIVGHVAKAGFDWLGSKLWNKALTISAKDYAAFHAWKKKRRWNWQAERQKNTVKVSYPHSNRSSDSYTIPITSYC